VNLQPMEKGSKFFLRKIQPIYFESELEFFIFVLFFRWKSTHLF